MRRMEVPAFATAFRAATRAPGATATGNDSTKRVPCPTWLSQSIVPVVLAHDAVGDRQTEAGALVHRLGGEERVVDAGEILVGNAAARVGQLRR